MNGLLIFIFRFDLSELKNAQDSKKNSLLGYLNIKEIWLELVKMSDLKSLLIELQEMEFKRSWLMDQKMMKFDL